MTNTSIYQNIANRTNGDIYIGVVGPVRTGKSTFIKRFMETLVIPRIDNVYRRERARDELPQSGSGRTIMTAEPKFVPEEAVEIRFGESAALKVRLIDCVGYLVDGALGQYEDEQPRMVMTPWFEHEIPVAEAAETGTRKVICEHATVGLVVTTDGSITDLPRDAYVEAEDQVIRELQNLGKPFAVVVNSVAPDSEQAQKLCAALEAQYQVSCVALNCQTLDESGISALLQSILDEFPLKSVGIVLPSWANGLEAGHPVKAELFDRLREISTGMRRVRDVYTLPQLLQNCAYVQSCRILSADLGDGTVYLQIDIPPQVYYDLIAQQCGVQIQDESELLPLLRELSETKQEYDRIAAAMEQVRAVGYGIVMPSMEEMRLEEPEIVRQGSRFGVRLRASAPSIHMIRADIQTEISPAVGSEAQSEELVKYLLSEFDDDPQKIWQSNIFGKTLHELVSEGLNTKLSRMPQEARAKFQDTLQRIINEGSNGLICIIL